MATDTNQVILSEIRQLRNNFDELSFQIRIDTPWVRVRENVKHFMHLIREIPIACRSSILIGCVLFTIPLVTNLNPETKKKLLMLGLDCFGLAFVLMGSNDA